MKDKKRDCWRKRLGLSSHPAKGRIVGCLLNALPFIDFTVCPLTYQCCN